MTKKFHPTPVGLGPDGVRLWQGITSGHILRSDELTILESACRATDRVVAMEKERDGVITAIGSTGQVVVHPIIAEVRAHEAQIAGLLAKLKLPDSDAAAGESNQQRDAANSRWATAYGK